MKDLGWAHMVENEVHTVAQMGIEIHEKDGMVSERVDDIVGMEVVGMVHGIGGGMGNHILDCLQKSEN